MTGIRSCDEMVLIGGALELKKRIYGLDIFRVLCCIGVLVYHIMGAALSGSGGDIAWYGKLIYYLASFCVPGFFVLSGYLLSEKEKLPIEYIENKVTKIMSKLFGWIVFWTVVHFIRTGEVGDIWANFTDGVLSRGILPVAWFLFTYCFLMITGYLLYHFERKCRILFCALVVLWMGALAMGWGNDIMVSKTQSLWFHLYAGYFCLGISLNYAAEFVSKYIKGKCQVCIALSVNVICMVIYIFSIKNNHFYFAPNSYYGKWYYTLWLISLFWLALLLRIENRRVQKVIVRLSENTLVVYLAPHLPTLYILSVMPLNDAETALCFIVLLFIGAELLAEGFRKMPLLRKLV